MEFYYKHYIRLDADKNIIYGFSTAFEQPKDSDILLTDKGGYQFRLFPGGIENLPLMIRPGIYKYRYVNGEVAEKTPEEIQAEVDALPKPAAKPTLEERTSAMETAVLEMIMAGTEAVTWQAS